MPLSGEFCDWSSGVYDTSFSCHTSTRHFIHLRPCTAGQITDMVTMLSYQALRIATESHVLRGHMGLLVSEEKEYVVMYLAVLALKYKKTMGSLTALR